MFCCATSKLSGSTSKSLYLSSLPSPSTNSAYDLIRKAHACIKMRPAKVTSNILKMKYPVKPLGEKPMVSTFHFKIRDFANNLSTESEADGFGTIKCRHMKYQLYIHVMTAIGIMNTNEPNMSIIFLALKLTLAYTKSTRTCPP